MNFYVSLFYLITILFIFKPLGINAKSIFTCEAKRVSGKNQTLEINAYENNIFPTIIIDDAQDTLLYIYSEHGHKWEQYFNITKRDENNIAGINKFQADWITVIHFNFQEKDFSISYIGYSNILKTANTLTFGKCYSD